MSKRKYTKKSDYWNKFDESKKITQISQGSYQPASAGETYYVANASTSRGESGSGTTSRRRNRTKSWV